MAQIAVTEAPSTEPLLTRQVRALYQALLGREPDSSGFAFWTGAGQNALGAMGNSFLTSPESIGTGVQTLAIYQAVLGRLPTFTEFNSNQLRTGGPISAAQLFNQLLGGPPQNNGYFVTNLYTNLLGRAPSPAELNPLVNSLNFGTTTPYGAFQGLFTGAEFQNLGADNRTVDHSNALYVTLLYLEILGRDPDPSGFAFWLSAANSGGPGVLFQPGPNAIRNAIMGPGAPGSGFIGSGEFQGRF